MNKDTPSVSKGPIPQQIIKSLHLLDESGVPLIVCHFDNSSSTSDALLDTIYSASISVLITVARSQILQDIEEIGVETGRVYIHYVNNLAFVSMVQYSLFPKIIHFALSLQIKECLHQISNLIKEYVDIKKASSNTLFDLQSYQTNLKNDIEGIVHKYSDEFFDKFGYSIKHNL